MLQFGGRAMMVLVLLAGCARVVFGQADSLTQEWVVHVHAHTSFFQSAFFNWTEGGENTTAISFLGNMALGYRGKKVSWQNKLLVQYGTQRVGGKGASFSKSADKLEWLSFVGWQASDEFYYSLFLNAKTQLAPTKEGERVLSKLFAPIDILVGPGIKFTHGGKGSKADMTFNFSPATMRLLIVADPVVADAGVFTGFPAVYDAFGAKLESGEVFLVQIGNSLVGSVCTNLTDEMGHTTNLELFSDYEGEPEDVDVRWFNAFHFKIWKMFTVSLSTDLRWDKDVLTPEDTDNDGIPDIAVPKVRFAQTFGVGIGLDFDRHRDWSEQRGKKFQVN